MKSYLFEISLGQLQKEMAVSFCDDNLDKMFELDSNFVKAIQKYEEMTGCSFVQIFTKPLPPSLTIIFKHNNL